MLMIAVPVGMVYRYMNSEEGRKWITHETVQAMQTAVGTKVKIDTVGVDITTGHLLLRNVVIDDQRGIEMLNIDTLEMDISMSDLPQNELVVQSLVLHGASATLYKDTKKGKTNMQFLLDAFKSKKSTPLPTPILNQALPMADFVFELENVSFRRVNFTWDVKDQPRKKEGMLDVNHLKVRNFRADVSGDILSNTSGNMSVREISARDATSGLNLSIDGIYVTAENGSHAEARVEGLKTKYQISDIALDKITVSQPGTRIDLSKEFAVKIEGLNVKTDNHKPHRRTLNPRRGYFDKGHMDIMLGLDAMVKKQDKGVAVDLKRMSFNDRKSGLIITNCTAHLMASKAGFDITNMVAEMPKTRLTIAHAQLDGKGTIQKPFGIKAHTILTDIAKPFAPPLADFTTPLNLTVNVDGTVDKYNFHDIHVTNNDGRLNITGQGDLCNVAKGKALEVHFWDLTMQTRNNITRELIYHFHNMTKMKMRRQMKMLGDIALDSGTLDVLYKKVGLGGKVRTQYGNLKYNVLLDGMTKKITGDIRAREIDAATIMNVHGLQPMSVDAQFEIINDKRLKRKAGDKGRLPIGWANIQVLNTKYSIFSIKRAEIAAKSDGSVALGVARIPHKWLDIIADFAYQQTDDDQHMVYKLGLRKHSDTMEELLEKEIPKLRKKLAKKEAERLLERVRKRETVDVDSDAMIKELVTDSTKLDKLRTKVMKTEKRMTNWFNGKFKPALKKITNIFRKNKEKDNGINEITRQGHGDIRNE